MLLCCAAFLVLAFCTVSCLLVVCCVVCVLWCSFSPCWQAPCHTVMLFNYLPLCDPASFSASTGMLALVMVTLAVLLMWMFVPVLELFESST